ncbi:hypothetical protein ACSFA3_05530 [Variovorax sp. RHLX14]|uniref:hypothetical protein n=1 Tax=Variovorax sp. RHLX14 TaxID=1259731 RepID=UPI003F47A58C
MDLLSSRRVGGRLARNMAGPSSSYGENHGGGKVGNALIRDAKLGPDGFLYVLTDESRGKLLRLKPP